MIISFPRLSYITKGLWTLLLWQCRHSCRHRYDYGIVIPGFHFADAPAPFLHNFSKWDMPSKNYVLVWCVQLRWIMFVMKSISLNQFFCNNWGRPVLKTRQMHHNIWLAGRQRGVKQPTTLKTSFMHAVICWNPAYSWNRVKTYTLSVFTINCLWCDGVDDPSLSEVIWTLAARNQTKPW